MTSRPTSSERLAGEAGFSLVELLVVVIMLGIVGSAITSVIISAQRVEQTQRQVQDVVDDGRTSLSRIRKELREARRVLGTSSDADTVYFWVDQNQDALVQNSELVCYQTRNIGPGQWEIVRWAGATTGCDSTPGDVQSVARTLVEDGGAVGPEPFSYDVPPSNDVDDPPVREVTVKLELEVVGGRDLRTTTVQQTIRLRNVA